MVSMMGGMDQGAMPSILINRLRPNLSTMSAPTKLPIPLNVVQMPVMTLDMNGLNPRPAYITGEYARAQRQKLLAARRGEHLTQEDHQSTALGAHHCHKSQKESFPHGGNFQGLPCADFILQFQVDLRGHDFEFL